MPAKEGTSELVPSSYPQAVHRAAHRLGRDVHRLSRDSSTGQVGQVTGLFVCFPGPVTRTTSMGWVVLATGSAESVVPGLFNLGGRMRILPHQRS